MFCVNCGKKIPEDSRFCVNCGAPVPEDDPAMRAPAVDPQLEWALEMPGEHAPRSEAAKGKTPRRRLKKNRSPAIAILLVLVVLMLGVVAVGALRLLSPREQTTLYEHLGEKQWSYAGIRQLKKGKTVLKAQTDVDSAAMSVWDSIAYLPFTPTEDTWAEQTLTDRGIFLTLAGGDQLLHLHVSTDGALRIRGEGIPTLCCTDAAGIHEALRNFLPQEETFPLEDVIAPDGWTSMSILYTGEEADLICSAFLADPDQIAECIAALRQHAPEAGKGYDLEERESVSLYLTREGGAGDLRIELLSNGCGDIPLGDWEYGIRDEALYRMLLEMMYTFG